MAKLIKDIFSWKFIKYVIVGVLGTSLDFLILYILVEYGHIFYLWAAVIAVSIVLWISFTLNKYWTFGDFDKNYFQQFAKYVIAHALAMAVNLLILVILVEIFDFWYILAKFIATAVSAITNFLLIRRFIFDRELQSNVKPF